MSTFAKKIAHWALWLLLFCAIIYAVDYFRTQSVTKNWPGLSALQPINAEPVDVAALSQQQKVMIYVWATWCGPCKVVSPSVNWLAKYFNVVTIALDSGTDTELSEYLKRSDLAFPTVNDSHQVLGRLLGVHGTPTVLVVESGQVVSATMGVSTPVGLWLRMIF